PRRSPLFPYTTLFRSYPAASTTVIFIVMAIVLLVKEQGLFGKSVGHAPTPPSARAIKAGQVRKDNRELVYLAGLLAVGVIAPYLDRKSTRLNSSHVKI